MIIDDRLELADAWPFTASGITDVIDLQAGQSNSTLRNLGGGEVLYLVVVVDTTVTAAGAATVAFSLESDSTGDLATTPTVHFSSGPVAKAALVAGFTAVCAPIPSGQFKRYLGLRVTIATGPLTAGKFNVFLTNDPSRWQAHADAVA